MDQQIRNSFSKWDEQVNIPQEAYIRLNNLYLQVERGQVELTIHVVNQLWTDMITTTFGDLFSRNYWEAELEKLPRWNQI